MPPKLHILNRKAAEPPMPSPPDLSQAFSQPKRLFTYGPLPQRINYVNVTFITEVISNKKEMNDYYLPNFLFC